MFLFQATNSYSGQVAPEVKCEASYVLNENLLLEAIQILEKVI